MSYEPDMQIQIMTYDDCFVVKASDGRYLYSQGKSKGKGSFTFYEDDKTKTLTITWHAEATRRETTK